MKLRAERLDLRQQGLDQAVPGAEGNARNVVDRLLGIKLGALAADLVEDVDEMAFDVEQAQLEHAKQADRACADDKHVSLDQITHEKRSKLSQVAVGRWMDCRGLSSGHSGLRKGGIHAAMPIGS